MYNSRAAMCRVVRVLSRVWYFSGGTTLTSAREPMSLRGRARESELKWNCPSHHPAQLFLPRIGPLTHTCYTALFPLSKVAEKRCLRVLPFEGASCSNVDRRVIFPDQVACGSFSSAVVSTEGNMYHWGKSDASMNDEPVDDPRYLLPRFVMTV